MKGVRVLRDEATNKRIIQIHVDEVDSNDEWLEDVINIILAEDAKADEMFRWEDVKKMLKAEGKL